MPEFLSKEIDSFQTGDIIVTQRNTLSPVYHTTMFLQPEHSPLRVASFAHAGQDVTEVLPTTAYKSEIPPPHRRYVFADRGLAVSAAQVAITWSTRNIATRYGDAPSSRIYPIPSGSNANRYSGMQAPASHAVIPFEASALLRLLKWTQRAHEGQRLSEKRGITCCAFISACVQTAALSDYLRSVYFDLKNLRDVNATLNKEFESKAEVRKRAGLLPLETTKLVKGTGTTPDIPKGTQVGLVGQALRANSNRLPLGTSKLSAMTLDDFWTHVQVDLCGIGDWVERKTLAQIIPGPFFHDVKYMSTKLMETGLDAAAWRRKDYEKY